MASSNGVIEQLVDYVTGARTAELPPEVLRVEPFLGAEQTSKLIETIRDLDQFLKVRDLRPLLAKKAWHVA